MFEKNLSNMRKICKQVKLCVYSSLHLNTYYLQGTQRFAQCCISDDENMMQVIVFTHTRTFAFRWVLAPLKILNKLVMLPLLMELHFLELVSESTTDTFAQFQGWCIFVHQSGLDYFETEFGLQKTKYTFKVAKTGFFGSYPALRVFPNVEFPDMLCTCSSALDYMERTPRLLPWKRYLNI